MKVEAIIAAGGIGTRLKTVRPKPLVLINGKPLIAHTIQAVEECPLVDSIVVVTHEYHFLDFEDVVRHYNFKKVARVVIGGATRCESVYNGLRETAQDTDIIVIHDGARPLIRAQTIQQAIGACVEEDAVVVGIPVKATIKKVDPRSMKVEETPERSGLWEIQTPQAFKRELLLKAHAQRGDFEATDDAALVERMGVKVKVIAGQEDNIKVTTNEDLTLVEVLLKGKVSEETMQES